MNQIQKTNDFAPAFLLLFMAPLLTEVLPGATRFSSIFVLPIEVCVWGGGALMIRYAVRRWRLGWPGMLFLALALALAEECIIQQTSLAPLVIRLKGVTYARALGINYVYLLWALIYEPTFVVFASVYLVELIFPSRRERTWISKGGFFAVIPLFLLGSVLAWYSWTRIARPIVFKLPIYNPSPLTIALSLAMILALIAIAFSRKGQYDHDAATSQRQPSARTTAALKPLAPWLLAIIGALWATLLFGLVLLGFGIAPAFSPLLAVAGGCCLLAIALILVPKWTTDSRWQPSHTFGLLAGTITGAMLISFVGFIGTTGPDLYFKIITNIIALALLVLLGARTNRLGISSN